MAKKKTSTAKTAAAKRPKAGQPKTAARSPRSSASKARQSKTKATAKKKAAPSKARPAKRTSAAAPAATRAVTAPRAEGASPDTAYTPPPPVPKTKLSDKQLLEFRRMLLDKRRQLVGDVDNLTDEALHRSRSEACGDLSSMPIHMADIGSDNWEQEFTLGLISNERALLREIDEALLRIVNRTYGVCLGTHKRISVARLRAKPWAKYCIEYARLHEQGRVP